MFFVTPPYPTIITKYFAYFISLLLILSILYPAVDILIYLSIIDIVEEELKEKFKNKD